MEFGIYRLTELVSNRQRFRSAILAIYIALCALPMAVAQSSAATDAAQSAPATPPTDTDIVIQGDQQLPDTYPRAIYEYHFHARGGVPPHHWRLEKGALPPGIKLEDTGLLHGQAERTGEFEFTVSVRDSSEGQTPMQKAFMLRVHSALSLNWKNAAHVSGNRIEGSVIVSNVTPDDMDLTFIVMAVAGNGRATAIGYQHFNLARDTVEQELPFGETLPNGGYVIHVDVVGDVPKRNLIFRERMESPSPLHVLVGP